MTHPAEADVIPPPRRARWRRIARRTLYAKLVLVLAVVVVAAAAYLRLVAGPVSLQEYSARVGEALASRLGPGWTVELTDTAIELQGTKPAVRASGLEIRDPAGVRLLRAPSALVSLDAMSLLSGTLSPREIELRDLQLTARVERDGSLSFLPSAGEGVASARPPEPSPPDAQASQSPSGSDRGPSFVSKAVASLIDPVLTPTNLVGGLERASVSGARLTLIGADGRQRVAFDRVGALFERAGETGRRMQIRFDGPRGSWDVAGEVRADGETRRADVRASQVPLEDLMLLSGLSGVPAGSDLKLTGEASASLSGARLQALDARFESSEGVLAVPGQKPLRIDRLSGRASWNEAERRLSLVDLDAKSGETASRLGGDLEPGPDDSWRLRLSGQDTTIAGATDRDPAVKVADLAADLSFAGRDVVLERLALKGDGLDVAMSGASLPGAAGIGMRAVVEATNTSVRRLLSLWPDTVNPELRTYLAANLSSGTLTRMQLKTELDPADLERAFSGRPISDKALQLSFAVADARLEIIDGLPPLRHLGIVGAATGTTTTLTAKQGRIDMPDGRRLNFLDGSYVQVDEDKPGSVAKIAFRLDGGADGLASLLRSPIFREVGGFSIDPATVKGRADLRVSFPLDVHNIPRIEDMPVSVAGTLSDIAVDRVVGREKLEGAQLAVTYERGALALRGEGRLGGSPATFDLRQPRSGPGEANVGLTLDEGARAKRSLPSAPQVTGPVPVKITAPFGPGAKGPTRFEADLSKAAIDGALPGWTKPAGRPGRVTFALADGDKAELRDLVLESGTVQLRGQITLGPEGGFEKAELATVKISPGDDLRAQVERNGPGYRVVLRGNVGDARPVLKWLTAAPSGQGKERDPAELDVDVGVNILTGHNDEAVTGVVAKVAARGKELKALQLRGQFRSAPVEVQLVRDGQQPQLVMRSGDAGAALRFLDMYKRMIGGELVVKTTIGDVQVGTIDIGSFGLRNEPALKSIASGNGGAGTADDRTGTQATARLTGDQVDFNKLTAEFRRSASRVDYKDVLIWGAQVGFTLSGYVDYSRDRTEILGTFVPAYGLNNAFSQVPIVGLILGGGNKNEGLFAIDFRVSGAASAPTLTVNPLTAVAPGILRKLFGWMMPEEDTTGTTPVPGPAQPRTARSRPQRAPASTAPASPPEAAENRETGR